MASDFKPSEERRTRYASALTNNGQPRIMGILNVTDDSFFEASRVDHEAAVERGLAMWMDGATWVDIGGESTRPGSKPVSPEVEIQRVIPVIAALRARHPTGLISIDTRRASVAQAALEAGADMVNDVSGLGDSKMAEVVLKWRSPVCVMHMQGEPGTMQHRPNYDDCVSEVGEFLEGQRTMLMKHGHPSELICLDPGIGFGKSQPHNMELLTAGRGLVDPQTRLLWGVSRKSIVGHLTGQSDPAQRLPGTLGLAAFAFHQGIDVLRVHDVRAHIDFFRALRLESPEP